MPAVSGSPTQIATSVVTALDLAGTPDDAFKAGDIANVSSLYPNSEFVLRRTPLVGAPNNVTTIATFSGNGYWELSPATFVSNGLSGLLNPPLATGTTTDATPLTLANVVPSFLALPATDVLLDTTVTVIGQHASLANGYRIDLNGTFTVSTAGVVALLSGSSVATANERFAGTGIAGMATIDATGNIVITGIGSENWYWTATISTFYRRLP